MCLHPCVVYLIPEQTAEIARAILPQGNLCLRLYDELGSIYSDPLFTDLFPRRGQPATSPTRLALVLVLQFLENLTDRQAAEAVRLRIDWKYLLGLELTGSHAFNRGRLCALRVRTCTRSLAPVRRPADAFVPTLRASEGAARPGNRRPKEGERSMMGGPRLSADLPN